GVLRALARRPGLPRLRVPLRPGARQRGTDHRRAGAHRRRRDRRGRAPAALGAPRRRARPRRAPARAAPPPRPAGASRGGPPVAPGLLVRAAPPAPAAGPRSLSQVIDTGATCLRTPREPSRTRSHGRFSPMKRYVAPLAGAAAAL